MSNTCQRIVLASRPQGRVTPENFRLERVPLPEPGPGQLRVRVRYLSRDPYMRGRMEETRSCAESQKLGETMIGGPSGIAGGPGYGDMKSMVRALRTAAPRGIDALFENVGGMCLDAALACMNPFGRVTLCGLIAGFNGEVIGLLAGRNFGQQLVKLA